MWSTPRDEIPSWSTPTVWRNAQRTEIVTNAAQYARGYDPATGKELWRLAKKSEITVPTPVPGRRPGLRRQRQPADPADLRDQARGDRRHLAEGRRRASSEHVAWSKLRGGPYMPTPIVYGPHLYICSNAGVVTCYEAATGKEVYRERIGGESYTASPVAADGRLYFVSEQGEVRVVKAGAGVRAAGGQRPGRRLHGDAGDLRRGAVRAQPALPVRAGATTVGKIKCPRCGGITSPGLTIRA